mgnify:CR=1 FL=1
MEAGASYGGWVTTGPQTFKGRRSVERDADLAQWYGWHWLCTGRAVLCYIAMQKHNEFSRVKTPEAAIHYFLRFVAAKALVDMHGHYAECVFHL